MIPGLIMPRAFIKKASGKSVSYIGFLDSTTPGLTYTFSGAALGTPDSTRLVIISIHTPGGGSATVSSVTIGGVTATAVVSNTSVTQARTYLYQAAVPTGSTGTIVVNFAASPGDCLVFVYAAYNLSSNTAAATANGTASPITLNTVAGGILIAAASFNGSTMTAATWTGATQDDFQQDVPGSQTKIGTVAHTSPTVTATPQSVSASITGSLTNMSMVAATWN